MVLLRPTTVAMMAEEKPVDRAMLSVAGVQLVHRGGVIWARKGAWLRNPPYTVGPWAHLGQLEVRIAFGEAARQAKGEKGLKDTKYGPLPPACAHVIDKVTGYKAPDRLSAEAYPSRIRRTAYTVEQLKRFMRAKRRAARAPVLGPPPS